MSLFDGQRLTNRTLRLDLGGIRRGIYADRYFANVVQILEAAAHSSYTFAGEHKRPIPHDVTQVHTGDIEVEAQVFSRRAPRVLVAGVDAALVQLRYGTGYFDGVQFVETWDTLDIEAVEDGAITHYAGNPLEVQPVLRIRGRYRDFALLETTILGVLTRLSRIATNVLDVVEAANGKPVLFFPARFELPEVQPADGYAYWLGVQRYNYDTGRSVKPSVSTDAQAAWWGGVGSGTVPHALIAAYMGDTAEAMIGFAATMPPDVPRIALVDFNNDTVSDSRAVLAGYWHRYLVAKRGGDETEMRRWTLDGVRLDTSYGIRDQSLPDDAPTGVNPVLVRTVRAALDSAWESWDLSAGDEEAAKDYCRQVKIVVTGGFNRERVAEYERDGVPADIYGVGSTLLRNEGSTNTDYTMDIVRVNVGGEWVDMAKVGRAPGHNTDLQRVNMEEL